jgi:hypothetical protein
MGHKVAGQNPQNYKGLAVYGIGGIVHFFACFFDKYPYTSPQSDEVKPTSRVLFCGPHSGSSLKTGAELPSGIFFHSSPLLESCRRNAC